MKTTTAITKTVTDTTMPKAPRMCAIDYVGSVSPFFLPGTDETMIVSPLLLPTAALLPLTMPPTDSLCQRTVEAAAAATEMTPELMALDAEDVSDQPPAAKRSCSAAPEWLFNDVTRHEDALRASIGLCPRSHSTPGSK